MLGFERGAEWRRWDLHLHTPGTQKNDQYLGNNIENKWDQFYQTINEYIGNGTDPMKTIAVIGITDYLSVDNYFKVIKDGRMPASVKMVLPNVEMRMIPLAKGKPINIHCLFDPALINELESRFFSKLTFLYGETNYSASHDDLRRLGREFSAKYLSDEEAYRIGLEQFVITLDTLKKVFKGDPDLRSHTIIAVSNSSKDGVSGVSTHADYTIENGSQMDATRQSIYKMVDLIFSSNDSDVLYFLGEKNDNSKEEIIKKYGSLKGCIHGSDAHKNNKVFEPDGKRYCWIKSDPTFNGLKQIIYEPKARIRISPIKPEEKPAYQVIDSVIFSNSDFQKEKILFNDKLTCIIGGKSTGKSLLLHNMALAIDTVQVNKKINITNSKNKIVSEIEVKWADGGVSRPDIIDEEHKIVYVPQTYLNRLTDENEEQTEIDTIIHDIIIRNKDAASAFETMKTALGIHKKELDKRLYDCVQHYNSYIEKKNELSDIGRLDGIKSEIKRLKKIKKEQTKDISITPEEIVLYDNSISAVKTIDNKISALAQDMAILSEVEDVFQPIELPLNLSGDVISQINEVISKIQKQANDAWIKEIQIFLNRKIKEKASMEFEKKRCKDVEEQIAPKIAGNELLKKLSEQIAREEEKLNKYCNLEKQVSAHQKQFNDDVELIIKQFKEFKKIKNAYAETINKNTEISNDTLVFSVTVPFRAEVFCKKISEIFDKRSIKKCSWLDLSNFDVDIFMNEGNIKEIIELTLSKELRPTKGNSSESILRDIFSDWYNLAYNVTMDEDTIGSMSPGKKALVLLKLLINLDESKCPILIDQPEDDLDNRSIYDELIPFIRCKKIDRQIIIVTHNANIVLGGDAEEVIVANQNGKNSPNKEYRFEYRSGSIEDDLPLESDVKDVLSKQGIQQHICDIMEGGERAFDLRRNKYRIERWIK